MISVVGANQDPRESETRVLGDVLYAGKAKAHVSEKDWVRLVQSIAAGDQLALHSLYEQMHRIVFTLIMRITNNLETAEELTLDVFHDVWQRAANYDPANGSVVGWIMNQARSRSIDRLRFEHRKKRFNNYGDSPWDSPLTTTEANDPQQTCYLQDQSHLQRTPIYILTQEECLAHAISRFSQL